MLETPDQTLRLTRYQDGDLDGSVLLLNRKRHSNRQEYIHLTAHLTVSRLDDKARVFLKDTTSQP